MYDVVWDNNITWDAKHQVGCAFVEDVKFFYDKPGIIFVPTADMKICRRFTLVDIDQGSTTYSSQDGLEVTFFSKDVLIN